MLFETLGYFREAEEVCGTGKRVDTMLPEASFANVAASTVDSGEALENRNDGFGKRLLIFLSQYRFRNAFGVNGFLSPATTSPTEITCMDENLF
jgi:hypothetical protein